MTGALAGAANGFFGAGGGLFLVPPFTKWCGMEEKAGLCDLGRGDFSAVRPCRRRCIMSGAACRFRPRSAIFWAARRGGVLAGRIFGRLRTLWLRRAFALLILYGGIRAVLLL